MIVNNRIEINKRNINFDIWIKEKKDLYIIDEITFKICYLASTKDYMIYDMPRNFNIKYLKNIAK